MATAIVKFKPGSLSLSRKPRIILALVDGKALFPLDAEFEHKASQWQTLGEMLGAAVPQWRKMLADARGEDYAASVLGAAA